MQHGNVLRIGQSITIQRSLGSSKPRSLRNAFELFFIAQFGRNKSSLSAFSYEKWQKENLKSEANSICNYFLQWCTLSLLISRQSLSRIITFGNKFYQRSFHHENKKCSMKAIKKLYDDGSLKQKSYKMFSSWLRNCEKKITERIFGKF